MRAKRNLTYAALLGLVITGFFCVRWPESLPHKRLADGGEFRVLQVTYGPSPNGEHNLGRAPFVLFWLWRHLPRTLQNVIAAPDEGLSCQSSGDRSALSIWWAWINPVSHSPLLGPSGDVVMTLDSGENMLLEAEAAEDEGGRGFRQIFLIDPPRHSRHFHFDVPVNDESVEFTIVNPAYRK